jgi:serine protease Do
MPTISPRRAALAGLLALALGSTALTALPPGPLHAQGAPATTMVVNYADLAERVGAAVVSVAVTQAAGRPEPADLPPQLRRFFEQMPQAERDAPRRQGQGSGFIVDAAGIIVTNHHVVGGASEVRVKLADQREFPARVLGSDARTDLAVLKIEAENLPTVRFAVASPRVGEPVMAMGNPFGLGGTVTSGIVSARGRDIGAGPADQFLQHDAAINPGNSGGPLFNMAGEVVGVNTAILSPTGGNIGIGFAVPAEVATKVVAELRETGTVSRGWFGIVLAPVEPTLAAALGRDGTQGAVVREVAADSPAAKAGLRVGDVIVGLAGRPVESPRDVTRAASTSAIGERVMLQVLRRDGTHQVAVTLGAAPQAEAPAKPQPRRG